MSEKLTIANEMAQLDRKNRNFYDDLTDEELKKFSNYLMIRWGSSVHGDRDMQEFYLLSANERLNKHFFAINRHPKLQWLCATAVSPGLGPQRHQWIAPKKKDDSKNTAAKKKLLMKLYPNMKSSDIDVLNSLVTQKELDAYIGDHGEK